jgi:hypothetical protein
LSIAYLTSSQAASSSTCFGPNYPRLLYVSECPWICFLYQWAVETKSPQIAIESPLFPEEGEYLGCSVGE